MTDEAKWIVEALRMCPVSGYGCNDCPVYIPGKPCQNELNAADLIESLAAELEQVKRERDAAVEDLKGLCDVCAHFQTCEGPCCWDCDSFDGCESPCKTCSAEGNWQWRGVKEENP